MSADVARVEFKGHLLFPGGTTVQPFNTGSYYYSLTLSYSPQMGVSTTSTRAGVIVPRPGSTYAQVQDDIISYVQQQLLIKSAAMLWFELVPNVVFGYGEISEMPREVPEKPLLERIKEDQEQDNA